jgi:hypothetical protein
LKKYTPLLIFEEFLEKTWAAQNLSMLGYLFSFFFLSLFFSFFFSFFSEHPSLFLDIWIEVVVKEILGALLRNKRASNG